jgi:hypothetical protein
MKPPAKLSELTSAIDLECEEYCSLFDRDTGRIVAVDSKILRAVEECEEDNLTDLPEWQKQEIEIARDIANAPEGRFIAPPNKFDFDEYQHMERFILSLSDEEAVAQLWNAIKGSRAFRHFKDVLYRLGIQDQWFRYRDGAMKEYVIEWAEAHDVPYEDDAE